ncbi:MAG: ABC transporter substrate-binding protein [Acetobacteraceae bacterium]|nr:ABC transporter substrate-binding protein [Acetobacteraceae bacterium]
MQRRTLLSAGVAGAAALALPARVRAESQTTLKFIPYADLALLDPSVSAFVTRNHALMVFDTLFAWDDDGVAQPQMLASYGSEPDGLTWTLRLRDGLKFHDGTPVLARDAVASIKRWWISDAFGQALATATDELSAPDDKTLKFRLKRRFPLLPDALAHPTNTMAVIMPERLANTPPEKRLTEMVGSGPFRYVASERVPGARNVYAKFDAYLPREGTPSFCAGPRIAYFDRVEWLTTPDPATQVAALKAGEVDYVEQPLMDLVPSLAATRGLRVETMETKGLIGFLRFNQTFPPFDNPRIRRAVLQAVNQVEFMEAVVGSGQPYNAKTGLFTPGTKLANDAGMQALSGKNDLDTLRREIAAAGYQGEKIVYLEPTDVPRINAIAEVGADMLRKLGFNVDVIATDWGTTVQRSVSRQPPEKGGWHMFSAFSGGWDMSNPGSHQLMRGNGPGAYNGWPTLPKLESLRDQWLFADDRANDTGLARSMQEQALLDVPYLPLGSYYQPVAYRSNLSGLVKGLVQFTGIRRS